MIIYRPNPKNPNEVLVQASLQDVHALRNALLVCFARWGVPSYRHDDLAQWAEMVTWRKLEAGRVRGSNDRTPKAALLCFMIVVAWRGWQYLQNRSSIRDEDSTMEHLAARGISSFAERGGSPEVEAMHRAHVRRLMGRWHELGKLGEPQQLLATKKRRR